MTTDLKDIVKDILYNEDEFVLLNGENELCITHDEIIILIEYYLECDYEFIPFDSNHVLYTFNILHIYYSDDSYDTLQIESDNEIEQLIKDSARVDDWSDCNNFRRFSPIDY